MRILKPNDNEKEGYNIFNDPSVDFSEAVEAQAGDVIIVVDKMEENSQVAQVLHVPTMSVGFWISNHAMMSISKHSNKV